MLISYARGQTSVILRVKLRSTTAPYAGATGLSSSSSGLRIAVIADNEATTTAYTSAASNVETVTTLGVYSAPTSGKCRFRELDATNHPGVYEIQLADARLNVSNSRSLMVSITGLSGVFEVDALIPTTSVNPYDAVRYGLTSLPNAAAEASGGLITRGSGTGQMLVLSGGVSVAGMGNGTISSSTFAANALGAVWDELRSAHTTTGTFGAYVLARDDSGAAIAPASTALSTATWTGTRAGYLDNLSAGAVATASALTTVGNNVSAILDDTGTSGVVVASGSKTGYSLTQSFPANFASMAITAGGAVTAGTVSDKTGYSLATTPPTAAQIATQVWTEAVPGSYTSGQAGNVLGNVATGTPPTAAAIADAVWDEARAGHTTSGTFGQYVLARDDSGAAIAPAATALSTATWTGTRAGYLDNIATAPPTASAVATQVWSTAVPGSFTSGQAGNVLGNVATGTPPTAAAIADAVWDEARSGHTTTGTFGAYVLARTDGDAAIAPASTALSTATWTGTRAGYLDNLSAGAVSTASALSAVASNVSAILDDTGTTGVVVAAASKTGYALASNGLDSVTVETGVNARQALSVVMASAAGVLSGAGSGTITIKGGNVATTRITATTDSSGNRSSITLALPS